MKRLFAVVVVLLLALPALPAYAAPNHQPDFEPSSEFIYLYNMDTQDVIYEKNADKPAYPASLVKIMTCILALENTPDLGVPVVYPNYVQDYLYNYGRNFGSVSLAGMYAGEEMPMRELLYGMMLRSGNEVAMTIANHVAGGGNDPSNQTKFVEMMNKRAKELGATNTNFVNPNGLFDPQQVTTARDMATIARHALSLPGFMEIVSTYSYSAAPTNKNPEGLDWSTTIQMQVPGTTYYYPYLKGVKSGTLPQAGRCLISTATKDGFTYLLVTMGAPYLDASGKVLEGRADYEDHRRIYDWVFDSFKVKMLVAKNRALAEVPLRLNTEKDHIQLVTADNFTYLVPKDLDPATGVVMNFEVPEVVDAPVTKGDAIGWVSLVLYNEEVGRVQLLAAESVEASRILVILEQVKAVVASFWFKFAVIFVVLLIVLYIFLMIARNRNRRNRSKSIYKPKRRI
jgi:D-alanyl-D-alanine carboxypeptidase (penicillin-binding protein 5/6)